MSHRQDDRKTEWTKWVASRPGASYAPEDQSIATRFVRQPLQRPILSLLLILTFTVVIGGGSYALFGARVPALSADHEAVIDTLDLDGAICCIEHYESSDSEYLFVTVLEPSGFLRETSNDVTLRVIAIEGEELDEAASLDAPIDSVLPRSMAITGTVLSVPLGITDDEEHGLWLVDVRDPSEPLEIGLHESDAFITSVEAIDDQTALAHARGEYQFLDLSESGEVRELGTFRQPVGAVQLMAVDTDDGLLYHLESRANSVRIADVSDVEAASPLGRHVNPYRPTSQPGWPSGPVRDAHDRLQRSVPSQHYQDFAVLEETTYIAASDGGVEIVDVSDSTSPDTVGRIHIADARVVRIAIAEESLYVLIAEAESRQQLAYKLQTYDLADPEAPSLTGTVDRIESAPGRQVLETGGSHAFLGLYDTVVMIEPEI